MALKVLFADDDENERMLVERALRRQGHEVEAVPDGYSFLKLLYEGNHYDVGVIDNTMHGGMSGVEVLEELLKAPLNNVPPMILRSADDDIASMASRLGAVFVEKNSAKPGELLSAVEALAS